MESSERTSLKVLGRQIQKQVGEALGLEQEQYGQPIEMEEGPSAANSETVSIGYDTEGAVFSTPPAMAEEISHYFSHGTASDREEPGEDHNIVDEMLGNLGRGAVFPENLEALVDRYDEIAEGLQARANEQHQEYIEDRLPGYLHHLQEVRKELEGMESFEDAEELYERAKDLHNRNLMTYAELREEIESQGFETEVEIPVSADKKGTKPVSTAPLAYLERHVFSGPELFTTGDERVGLEFLRSAAEGERDVEDENLLYGGEIPRARKRVERSIDRLEKHREEGVERVLDGMVETVNIDQYDAEHVIGRVLALRVQEEGREEEVFHMSNEELLDEYGEEIDRLKQEYMFDGIRN